MSNGFDEIERAKQRLTQLREAQLQQPEKEIIGIVSASGASSFQFEIESQWTTRFEFEAWRVLNEPIQTFPLEVRGLSTMEISEKIRKALISYSVVRIRGRVFNDLQAGTHDALLVTFIGIVRDDREMNELVNRLKQPVMYEDATFGSFQLDKRLDLFTAEVLFENRSIRIHVIAQKKSDIRAGLKTAHDIWEDRVRWDRLARDYAVKDLLPIKNDSWLEDDESPLHAEEFYSRMELDSITANHDGSFEFWYSDDGMFAGHSIAVRGSFAEGFHQSDICG